MRRVIGVLCVVAMFGAPGCQWIKPSTGGAQVREATAAEVGACQELGTASGTTKTSLGLPRNKDVVRDEQVTLARNRASEIGGDTIVQSGPAAGGTLSFIVYRCR
ncbi:MAG: DUF4156 domain-containing protein [Proteobacteria bacterium]|nr:DUF4156 domain-containing protein [Pseudomonadota bacterium]